MLMDLEEYYRYRINYISNPTLENKTPIDDINICGGCLWLEDFNYSKLNPNSK